MSSRSGQPIERGFLLDRRRVLASSRAFLSQPREGLVSGRRSRAGRREDVFGAPGCRAGVQGSVSGAEEGGVRVFQLAFAGLWETWAAGARGSSKVREPGLAPRRASSGARPTTTCPCVVGSEEAEPPSSASSFREAVREEAGRPSAARSCPGEVRAPPGTGRDPRGKRLEEARGPRTTSEVEAVPRTARSDRSDDDIARRTSRAHRHPSSSSSRALPATLSTYSAVRLGIAEPSSFLI